ncbi:MAG: hypothetical protein JAZ03_16535, partial [Candidatus Thiodiazotropha taylori]|nr:hypothetical protein [Candidatus Thiodiazotropha taylori]MCW4335536.1 hypothetical protein [Candidatus Thiodiazotropha endolucinida]
YDDSYNKRSDQNSFEVLSSFQDGDSTDYESGRIIDDEGFTLVRKRQRVNTGGNVNILPLSDVSDGEAVEDIDFMNMTTDEKLSKIFSALTCSQNKIMIVEQKIDAINRLNGRVQKVEKVINSYNDRLKLLEYKSIDIEARSRRNNLLFRGIQESTNEDCRKVITDFLENKLGVDELPSMERVHRLGRYNRLKGSRPIIVAFSFYKEVEDILSLARSLKGTSFSISRDYPPEIVNARKSLWPKFKDARSNFANQVSIAYPAKLIINGVVAIDLFPDWNEVLRGSRISVTQGNDTNVTNVMNVTQTPTYASVVNDMGPQQGIVQPSASVSHEAMDTHDSDKGSRSLGWLVTENRVVGNPDKRNSQSASVTTGDDYKCDRAHAQEQIDPPDESVTGPAPSNLLDDTESLTSQLNAETAPPNDAQSTKSNVDRLSAKPNSQFYEPNNINSPPSRPRETGRSKSEFYLSPSALADSLLKSVHEERKSTSNIAVENTVLGESRKPRSQTRSGGASRTSSRNQQRSLSIQRDAKATSQNTNMRKNDDNTDNSK